MMSQLNEEPSVLEEGPLIWALDDDEEILSVLEHVMEEAGYRFEGMKTPQALLAQLERQSPLCDLLILDWTLPDISGAEVLRRIMASREWGGRPIVVLTAVSGESVLLNAFEIGAHDVMRKPFSVSELLARIGTQLSHRRAFVQLSRRCADLESLMELSEEIERLCFHDTRIRDLPDTFRRACGARSCEIFLLDEERGVLRGVTASALLDLSVVSHGPERIAQRRIARLSCRELERLEQGCREGATGLVVPLMAQREFLGVVLFVFGPESPADLSTKRAHFIEMAAGMVARGIERALFMDQLERLREDDELHRVGLKRVQGFLWHVVESSAAAVIAAGAKGEILLCNGAAIRLLGRRREEMVGDNVRSLYPRGGAEEIMRAMRQGGGRVEGVRVELVDAAGETIPVEMSATILEQNEEEVGTVGIFTDLRERLAIEQRLEKVTQDLEHSRQRAIMAELAGATAHELNQPLTSLLNYAQLLVDTPLDDPRLDRASTIIVKETEQIAAIVKRLGQITSYRTRDYVEGARIVDLGSEHE